MADPGHPPRIITAHAFARALADAGVIDSGDYYRHIVIDARAGEAVRVYAERYADERLLNVAMTLDGIEVTTGIPAGPPAVSADTVAEAEQI